MGPAHHRRKARLPYNPAVFIHQLEDGTGASGRRRIAARVRFENSERPEATAYFEFEGVAPGDVVPGYEAFAQSFYPLATHVGEERLHVDGALCGVLRRGLDAVGRVLDEWYPGGRTPTIEAAEGWRTLVPRQPARAALLFSSGVDALSSLRGNRLDLPRAHPFSFQDAVTLFGVNIYDFKDGEPVPARLAAFEHARRRRRPFLEEQGLAPIAVWSNARSLYPDYASSRDRAGSALMLAPIHLLAPRIGDASISTSGLITRSAPHGFHPLLDTHYSSSATIMRRAMATLPRSRRVQLIADWPAGLSVLSVCHRFEPPPDDGMNCGRCEKCVRTMLQLLVVGALDRAPTFPKTDVSPEDVRIIHIASPHQALWARQSIAALRGVGRNDLAIAMARRVERYEWPRWKYRLVRSLRRRGWMASD